MLRFVIVVLCLIQLSLNCIGEDSTVLSKEKNLHLYPFAFYTKETGIALGAAGLLYLKPKSNIKSVSPVSSIQFTVDYTIYRQFNIEFWYQLFLRNDKYRVQGFIDFNSFPYYYYGIGKNVPEEEKEHYMSDYARQRIQLLRRLYKNTFGGLRYWNEYYLIKDVSTVGRLQHQPKMGFISSLGPIINYDTRDDVFYPRKGLFWETSYQISTSKIGSSFDYKVFVNDVRLFFSLHKKVVFAFQHYMQSMSGDIPFNQLAMLGGHRKLRGYYLGRYRDNNMLIHQAELRGKINSRWGTTFFGGVGSIYPDFNKPKFSCLESSIGAGVRYKLSKSEMTNIRLDFAVGRMGNKGLYIVIDEAF